MVIRLIMKSEDDEGERRDTSLLRPRGSKLSNLPRNRYTLPIDPFITCNSCGTDLTGFFYDGDDRRRYKKTVVLSCGHVVCPECSYKWQSQSKIGSHFMCNKCNDYVLENHLPNRGDVFDRACETCAEVSAASAYCNTCRVRLCQICAASHVIDNTNHNVINVSSKGHRSAQPQIMNGRLNSCLNHGNRLKYRCACGELRCERCLDSTIEPKFLNGVEISHTLYAIEYPDITIEDVVEDPMKLVDRLTSCCKNLSEKRNRYCESITDIKNELCLLLNQMHIQIIQRAETLLNAIDNESTKQMNFYDEKIDLLKGLLRRVNVGIELDERCRSYDNVVDNHAADVLRSISYSILKPLSEHGMNSYEYNINESIKMNETPYRLSFVFDAEKVMNEIATFGEVYVLGKDDEKLKKIDIDQTERSIKSYDGLLIGDLKLSGEMNTIDCRPRVYNSGARHTHLQDIIGKMSRRRQLSMSNKNNQLLSSYIPKSNKPRVIKIKKVGGPGGVISSPSTSSSPSSSSSSSRIIIRTKTGYRIISNSSQQQSSSSYLSPTAYAPIGHAVMKEQEEFERRKMAQEGHNNKSMTAIANSRLIQQQAESRAAQAIKSRQLHSHLDSQDRDGAPTIEEAPSTNRDPNEDPMKDEAPLNDETPSTSSGGGGAECALDTISAMFRVPSIDGNEIDSTKTPNILRKKRKSTNIIVNNEVVVPRKRRRKNEPTVMVLD